MTTPTVDGSENNPSIAEKVAAKIREEIMNGTLEQGSPLREIALAELHGVSRRTIREALLLLARQKLAAHERNRGAIVRTLEPSDVLDFYRVRRTLELEGARNAPFASEERREALKSSYQQLSEATFSRDSREMVRYDLAFHGAVVGLANSERLSSFYNQMGPEMEMALAVIRDGEQLSGFSADQVIADHQTIHDALIAREVIEAQRAIIAHIELNERYLLTLLRRT